ncbi:MAG TPA: hypothetical protein VKU40_06710, partial [Thermoanaerobaculia bacterium]|nr:hypothetical protein [Thermoanaerobaculia bacterium]
MTYPGNPSISPEVQQRIRSTFEQTLGLAERGSHQEAALGCDFVLQLDPQFQPARTLADRLRQTDGAVEVEDLRDLLAGRPSPAARKKEADALFGEGTDPGLAGRFDLAEEMADLDAELPEMGAGPDGEADAETGEETVAAAPSGDLKDRMEELFDDRRYGELLTLAGEHTERVGSDPRLGHMATTAAARQEAAPYVERFLAAAKRAHEKGDDAEATALLDKARALDDSHPGLAAAERGTAAPAAAPPPPAQELPSLDLPDDEPADDPFADESDPRIAELLSEGQAAFERDDHQGAIDSWSRIFLIDIDHAEASRRIEEARRLKSEQERRIEEAYHDALSHLEAGRLDEARAGFEQVLELSPGHLAAREQLDRIDSGEALAKPVRPTPPAAVPPPTASFDADPEPLKEEIMVPPDPGDATAASAGAEPARPSTAATSSGASRRFALIGSLVLVLVLVGAYVVWSQWDSFFPNADDAQPVQATETDPIARAMRLHDSGRTAMAINQLRRLPPSSPQYEEAQALISQWEAAVEPPDDGAGDAGGETVSAGERARQAALIAEATAAVEAGENLRARSLLVEAEELAALPPAGESLKAETEEALRPFARYIDLLAQ